MTDELKEQAEVVAAEHNPDNDENVGCAVCGYSRHPCDAYDLAAATLAHLTKPAYVWLAELVDNYGFGQVIGIYTTSAAAKKAMEERAQLDPDWKVINRDLRQNVPTAWEHKTDRNHETVRYEIEGPTDV